MGHVAAAGFIGSGGYILYEAASGDSEQAKTDALRFVISLIPVAGGIQITGGSGTGGSITSGGALVLSGAGELSFAYSGEMTVEQGLVMIEGISGNPSGENSSKGSEEKDQDEIQEKVKEAVKKVPDEYKKYGKCDQFAKALTKELDRQGIDYEIVRVDSSYAIYSDKYEDYIGIRYHYGIKIENTVYDNLTLEGMNYNDWKTDLGIGLFGDIDCNITNEIVPY